MVNYVTSKKLLPSFYWLGNILLTGTEVLIISAIKAHFVADYEEFWGLLGYDVHHLRWMGVDDLRSVTLHAQIEEGSETSIFILI